MAKALFLSFCQKKCVLTIFRLFKPLKAFLIFLPNENFFNIIKNGLFEC
jgi:hypothetical protein